MKIPIRKVGNSQGILIPKPILNQLGFQNEVELEIDGDRLILRRPRRKVREGWAEAAKALAASGDYGLVLGDFDNEADSEYWVWEEE